MATDREPILCYVEDGFAWLTTQTLQDQWADDWDDAPYEANAGEPYSYHERFDGQSGKERWQIVKVAFDGDWVQPKDGHWNSPWSVQQINAKMVPWLRTQTYADKQIAIHAGTSLTEFCSLVKEGGGNVYLDEQTWMRFMREKFSIAE